MLDGEYTPSKPNIPMYKRMWNPSNPWSTSNNLSQLDAMDEVGSVSEKELQWYKENWFKLDLIDPQKWALFPGDVVIVTNKTHRMQSYLLTYLIFYLADYLRFGRVTRIYMPHGLIWVQGLNKTEPLYGVNQREIDGLQSVYKPFNYRFVAALVNPH